MSQAATLDSEPEFLASDLDKFYEVVDGQRVERVPLGTFPALIVSILSQSLGTHARVNKLGRVVFHMLYKLDEAGRTMRRPNVSFVSGERWAFDRKVGDGEFWEVIPELAIEVVRLADSAHDYVRRIKDYFQAGVLRVWVVYPNVRQVYVYESPTQLVILNEGQDLDGGDLLPGFRLSLAELFEDGMVE